MIQLSLFSDLSPPLASETPVLVPVAPVVPRPRRVVSTTAAEIASPNIPSKAAAAQVEEDTLLKLAVLIRDARAAAQAQSRLRSRPVQSIGDLAQSVLMRHDLVARRRDAARRDAAGQDAAETSGRASDSAAVQPATQMAAAGLAHTPTQVHVAS